MNNDKRIFDLKYNKIQMKLENFSLMEIDTTNLLKELKEIVPNNETLSPFQTQVDYEDAFRRLEKFESDLEDYEILFKIKNSTTYLSEFIKKDLNIEKVKKCSFEVITSLNELKKCTNIEMNEIRTQLFDIAYKVIKLEFVYLYKSETLDYIISNEMFVPELNTRILNDIKDINTSINELKGMDNLKSVLFERGKLGTDYVTRDVLKALVYSLNNNEIQEHIKEKVSIIKERTYSYENELKSNVDEKSSIESDIKYRRKNWLKSAANKRIIAAVLSTVIFSGVGIFLIKLAKKDTTGTNYLTSYTTSHNGELPTYSSDYHQKLERDYNVEIRIGDEKYDLTREIPRGTLDLEKEYLTLSDFVERGYLDNVANIDLNADYWLTITTQNLEDSKIKTDAFFGILVFMIILFDFMFYAIVALPIEYDKLPRNLRELSEYLKKQIEDKRNIIDIINEAKKQILSNEDLKSEFIEFYNENESIILDYINSTKTNDIEKINESFKNIEELKLRLKRK